jgi:mannosyltransferase OCH1-like enzyme
MESFETLIKKSYDFNQEIFSNCPRWRIIGELYDKNYVNNTDRSVNLPKKIHQIWLGSPLPDKYKSYVDSWREFHPDWEYYLWTNGDGVDIPRRDLYNRIKNLGQKSDFLRYHILNQFGGLYVDTDFECLKSFNTLAYAEFLAGVGYPAKPQLYIGLIGSVPGHSIISAMVSSLDTVRSKNWRAIFETTGADFFTSVFFRVIKEYTPGVVVLPTDYFYPFSNKKRHQDNGKDYIKDCSYAIHYWDVSWLKK